MDNPEILRLYSRDFLLLHFPAVTETFLNQLIDGNFDENMIIGVEENGEGTV